MPKTLKGNVPQSPVGKAGDWMKEPVPNFIKQAKRTSEKPLTVEQQWEIAKKHGLLITPTPGVPHPKMQSGPKAPK